MTVMNALQCGGHISALWTTTKSVDVKLCIYAYPFEIGFAISNFLLDLLIIIMPIPKVIFTYDRLVGFLLIHDLDMVLTCRSWPKIGCDWSLRTGFDVCAATRASKCFLLAEVTIFDSGLAASTVRVAQYLRITASKSILLPIQQVRVKLTIQQMDPASPSITAARSQSQ